MDLPTPRYLALSSDGQLTNYEMLTELTRDKIAPVLYYQQDDSLIVPVFKSIGLAKQFAKRNTNRKYAIGVMEASDEQVSSLIDSGFQVILLQWPNKRACQVHVLELGDDVETRNNGRR